MVGHDSKYSFLEIARLLRNCFSTPSILVALIIYLCGVIAFAGWTIWSHSHEILDQLDCHLLSAAKGAVLMLPPDYADRALGPGCILPEESAAQQRKLLAFLATVPEIDSIGTYAVDQGALRYTSGTLPEQRYWAPTAVLHVDEASAAGTGPEAPVYLTNATADGHFREVRLSMRSPAGRPLIAFATASLEGLNRGIIRYLPIAFLNGIFFLLLAAPLLLTFGRYWALNQGSLALARLQAESARMREEQTALEFLRFQLNPHFLFNALNSVCALIASDPAKAEEMTMRLSRFCRNSIFARNHHEASLHENLQVAQDYLDLEAIRWGEWLQVGFEVQIEQPEAITTPSFLLQPLLENAVKYGQRSGAPTLVITVRAWLHDQWLLLEVSNSGRWFEPGAAGAEKFDDTRFGLDNLRRRLDAYYGPGVYLTSSVTQEGGSELVRMTLTLPLSRRTR